MSLTTDICYQSYGITLRSRSWVCLRKLHGEYSIWSKKCQQFLSIENAGCVRPGPDIAQIIALISYLDCSFMFVQMRAMSASHGVFSSNTALAPLGSRSAPIFSS
jgi:hypothetical protein